MLGRCAVCKFDRLGFSVELLMVFVLDFSDHKTGFLPEKRCPICAKCVRRIIFCNVSGCTKFSTLSHKREDFRKKIIGREMCVSIFSTKFVCNISYYKKN